MAWLDSPLYMNTDQVAVSDCLRQANACYYFKWIRGTWIFFWNLSHEWQLEFWDRVKISGLPGAVLPEGHPPSKE